MVDKFDYTYVLKTKGIKETYRRLLIVGFTKKDAGNIIAELLGIGLSETGWTPRELQYLLFYKALNDKQDIEFKDTTSP